MYFPTFSTKEHFRLNQMIKLIGETHPSIVNLESTSFNVYSNSVNLFYFVTLVNRIANISQKISQHKEKLFSLRIILP